MSVRIVCEHCSGELQLPGIAPGKQIRCPLCGTVFVPVALAARKSAPVGVADAPTPWSPRSEEDLDDPIPWYILLGAIAPAGLLAFVVHEPIAFAVAAVLVTSALFLATRRDWSRWSRFMGVVSLALLGFGSAAAVNLYAQGNFANLGFRSLFAGGNNDREPVPSAFQRAAWNDYAPPEGGVKLLFPGSVTPTRDGHPSGMDIFVYEAKFPKEGIAFALRTFKISTHQVNDKTEDVNLTKMLEIVPWIFSESDPDGVKKIYYFDHPGYECSLSTTAGKKSTTICQAYLVRDRAYLVSVSAEKFEPIKPLADKFFASFRLQQPAEALRPLPRGAEPNWKALSRAPIPKVKPSASYRGHFRPPIMVLAFSQDGKQMVTGSGLEHVIKWDLESGHGTRVAGTEAYPFFAVHPGGKEMVVAFPNGISAPRILFLPLDAAVSELGPSNTDYIVFSADRKTAFVALETQITAWETNEDAKENKLWYRSAADTPLARLALSRGGRFLATTASIAAAAVQESSAKPFMMTGKETGGAAANGAAKAKEVIAKEPTIKLWDVVSQKTGFEMAAWAAHNTLVKSAVPIQQLAFAPDDRFLASAGLDNYVKIWDISEIPLGISNRPKLIAELIHIGEHQGVEVAAVEYSNDGKLVATGDFTGVVRVWEAGTWKLLHEFRACETYESVQTLRFSPDDAKLAAAVEMGVGRAGVHLFDIKSLPAAADSPSLGFQLTEEPPLFKEK